ncbi:MAG: hypothetical protein HQL37_07200 [Alphaproteobacteria bacterium]|nr:hypothetical protein [Alphaproteobacteria bacterium]
MMGRRWFLEFGLRKTVEVAVKVAGGNLASPPVRWFRPPFAGDEGAFLLACTRCDKCIDVCPHGVVFRLPARYGVRVAGTPVLDLLNRGCRLCEDWPCVAACEPAALKRPESGVGLPRLAFARIDPAACLPYSGPECGGCSGSCPVPGALVFERGGKPRILSDLCVGCGLCRAACIVHPKAVGLTIRTGGLPPAPDRGDTPDPFMG